MKEFGLLFDFGEKVGVGQAQVFDGEIFAVDQGGKREAVDEAFDLAGGHRLFLEVDELNGDAAFLEKSFGGAGSLRTFYSENLNDHQIIIPSMPIGVP
jgi:hypothetical protein